MCLDSQRQEEAAIVESVVAEDHAVLLKTVEKSKLSLVYVFPFEAENRFSETL